jgi:hypothetical protein
MIRRIIDLLNLNRFCGKKKVPFIKRDVLSKCRNLNKLFYGKTHPKKYDK